MDQSKNAPSHGDVTLDASFLARQFGLSVDQLRSHMCRGAVRSVVEKGLDDDAGRTRMTVRIGNRTWRGVMDAEGNLEHHGLTISSTGPRRRPRV